MFSHPAVNALWPNSVPNGHDFSRSDLFLVVFCIVDEWMNDQCGSSNAPRRRRGPRPDEFTDSEVLAIVLVGELCQVKRERAWLRQVRASYKHLFPKLLEDSRFSRRAQRLREQLRYFRRTLLCWAGEDVQPFRILDSFPLPLCACYRIRQSTQPISGSSFGYNSSKKLYFFGLHPGLLMTENGYIDDLFLAPGNVGDVPLLTSYLDECIDEGRNVSGQEWIMDKGFVSRPLGQYAEERLGLRLLVRQRDRKGEPVPFIQHLLDKIRKPIESVISVFVECFGIESMRVRSDIGIYRRTQAKATAYSLARYFNQALNITLSDVARYAV